MDEEDRKALIEEAASAWRSTTEEGAQAHPAWEQLDEAGRIEAFEIAQALRKMEAALDPDSLSTTGRIVLERVKQQAKSDVAPANVTSLDAARNGNGQPTRASDTSVASVISFPKRIMQSQPWAMAAVALLVVGVGVWAVRERHGPGTGSTDQEQLAATEESIPDQELEQRDVNLMDPAAVTEAGEERVEVAEAKPREFPRAGRRRRRRGDEPDKREPVADKEARDERPALAVKESSAEKDEQDPQQNRPELEAFAKGRPGETGSANALLGGEQAASATEQERKICRARVSLVEKLVSQNKDYQPVPEEQLAVGQCYRVLGKMPEAKEWLRRAAKHPETKARAEKALREFNAK
jgi:hypothetical protein